MWSIFLELREADPTPLLETIVANYNPLLPLHENIESTKKKSWGLRSFGTVKETFWLILKRQMGTYYTYIIPSYVWCCKNWNIELRVPTSMTFLGYVLADFKNKPKDYFFNGTELLFGRYKKYIEIRGDYIKK